MYLCNISTTADWVASTPIALSASPTIATNGNVQNNSDNTGAVILNAGWYNVRLEANVTATGTSVGAELYANGTAVSATSRELTTTAAGDAELVIEYPVHVVNAPASAQALIQFYATGAATPLAGYVTITKIQ